MDLNNPLADLAALKIEAFEDHNRGDEWATVAGLLIDEVTRLRATTLDQLEARVSLLMAGGPSLAECRAIAAETPGLSGPEMLARLRARRATPNDLEAHNEELTNGGPN